MCSGGGGGGSYDPAASARAQAEEQRRLEQERQQKIAVEHARINKQFAGYGDDYFGGIANDYVAHYLPELQRQYDKAREAIIVAAPGGGQGSEFNKALADLEAERLMQETQIKDSGNSFAQDWRRNIEGERSELLNMAVAGSGSGSAAQAAVSRAAAMAKPPAYSPLGDLFARVTANLANARVMGAGAAAGGPADEGPQLTFSSNGRRSSVVT